MDPQLSTGSCRHHWLARRASSLAAWKAGCLPPAQLTETQPLFPAAARKSPRPGLPGGPCSLQISRSGNFPCTVFQVGRASSTKGRERQQPSSPFHQPLPPPVRRQGRPSGQRLFPGTGGRGAGETQRTETVLSGEAGTLGSHPWRGPGSDQFMAVPISSSSPLNPPPQGGNSPTLALTSQWPHLAGDLCHSQACQKGLP